MKAVVQRVTSAKVETGGKVSGAIGTGLLVLFGIYPYDSCVDFVYIV